MIISQAKLNELLKIFEIPKSVDIYNNLKEKEDMKHASKFINDYHIYGPPPKKNYDNINNINMNTPINSINNSFLKMPTYVSKKFQTYQDSEIKRSLTNLKIGKEQYLKEQKTKSIKSRIPVNEKN